MSNVLFDKSPDDMFIAYKRSRENGNHKKAIKYLHTLLSEFPGDIYFLEEIIEFSLYLENLEAGKKWLKKMENPGPYIEICLEHKVRACLYR